jgi:hypothetical protein
MRICTTGGEKGNTRYLATDFTDFTESKKDKRPPSSSFREIRVLTVQSVANS